MIVVRSPIGPCPGITVSFLSSSIYFKEAQEIVEPILRKKYKDWKELDWIKGNIERAWLEYSSK